MDTSNVLTRRELLTGLAALGTAGVLRGQGTDPRAIDCHHHFVSPAYIKALQAKDGHHVAGYTTWFAFFYDCAQSSNPIQMRGIEDAGGRIANRSRQRLPVRLARQTYHGLIEVQIHGG
jgi:hypothetical protein